ncbi:MAG: Integrase core domain [Pedosphaera sp.]|nr:Integrase core domain [Pedosphaera sp.]
MHSDMSKKTKQEVMVRLRRFYAKAGPDYKRQLLDQAIGLFGYHRKAAIRALRAKPIPRQSGPAVTLGRPREYSSERLLPVLKPIWFAALQPCGHRLHALLPEWLPAYEADHHRIDADVRTALLAASARTLDRLVSPLRSKAACRGGTLDDRHLWMLDAVDIRTDWTEQRALENRGQYCTLAQIQDLEASLPFALRGLDSDNGGEFLNHHLVQYLHQRKKPVLFTRARPYHKNDNAHVEQRNWTHVRQHFGYERYDNPAVAPLINALCKGALGRLLNHFLPTQKLVEKRHQNQRITRIYGPAQTPYSRVLSAGEVGAGKKTELKALHAQLNPFQLRRDIERQKKEINQHRLLSA